MTRSRKKLIVGICIIAAVAISVAAILWLPGAKDRGDTSDSSTPNATARGAVRGYTPVLATAKIFRCAEMPSTFPVRKTVYSNTIQPPPG